MCPVYRNYLALLPLGMLPLGQIAAAAEAVPSVIKPDERVVFFPTAARLNDDRQTWIVPIHGWIFEPEANDALRTAFVRELRDKLDLPEDHSSTAIVVERIRAFLVDNERGKRVGIRIASQRHVLPPSASDGHFTAVVALPAAQVAAQLMDGRLEFRAITIPGDLRAFVGLAHCLPPTGTSVISDIDDTIKITDVRDKRELIRNTFLREFRAVDDMAAAYRRWADAGAQFHYVSSSPWQLYESLARFRQAAGFPDGTFHLKRFRMKDSSVLGLFENPADYKLAVIEPLLQGFPARRFILIGDSGEQDPEVYGVLARRYPDQVVQVYIRDVTDEPADAPRYQAAFRDLPPDKWQLFHDPASLPETLEASTR